MLKLWYRLSGKVLCLLGFHVWDWAGRWPWGGELQDAFHYCLRCGTKEEGDDID